jgi:hypothetical protein
LRSFHSCDNPPSHVFLPQKGHCAAHHRRNCPRLPSPRRFCAQWDRGHVLSLSLGDIKYICYVRDFNLNDTANPERLTRRTFLARPRTEGLWLRLTFRTEDQLEGLAPIDASLLDDLIGDAGLQLIPPDIRSNTQRVYVPRSAITELQLIAVITTPSRKKPLPVSNAANLQNELFNAPLPPDARPN